MQKDESDISVDMYHAETGKYLESQTFKYRRQTTEQSVLHLLTQSEKGCQTILQLT